MSRYYEVAYTPTYGPQNDTNREYEDGYRKLETAMKRAVKLVKDGCKGVMVDYFENEGDLLASYSVNPDGTYKKVC
jgi:hypothetical protein